MIRALLLLTLFTGVARADTLQDPLDTAGANAAEIQGFIQSATDAHGDFGSKAAEFLVQGMSEQDLKTLDQEFLLENLEFAMKARESFPWAKSVPDEVFFNDVLPYASLDETREPWRKAMYAEVEKLVAGCQTTTEAAQAINKHYFKHIDVYYNTGRKKPNQSPAESKALNKATCTGLSIILVDACRAVGVPARVAGTPLWTNKRGNHTWVEIWDGGQWYFTGADEYNAQGLNRGWFVGDASKARADDWKHAIWATSWRNTGSHFPMVWNLRSKQVAGVNVTARYARQQQAKSDQVVTYFRVFDKQGGNRMVVTVEVLDQDGQVIGAVQSKAGQADLNDMPSLKLVSNSKFQARLKYANQLRMADFKTTTTPETTVQWNWADLQLVSLKTKVTDNSSENIEEIRQWLELPPESRSAAVPQLQLSREEAAQATDLIYSKLAAELKTEREAEMSQLVVKAAGKEMKYLEKVFGDAKPGERSLWISMHGGGGAPARVNEQQWKNQIRLYQPEEGIMVAPRAPTDNWNLWHEAHIDALFDRLIENYVLLRGVSPDRVYLMGYSAGGDGVYQLAPRMADRLAAASMMAGHPNDASPLGLRNLPFMIFMGGDDGAYKRNEVAAQWGEKLQQLRDDDPQGYLHKVTIYEGLGHWMQGKDQEALPWMAAHTRSAWPQQIVWRQSSRTHGRFYWLAVPLESAQGGQTLRAKVNQQHIDLQAEGDLKTVTLRLSDQLVDLDQPLEVTVNGKKTFSGSAKRTVKAIWTSLQQRMDPASAACAAVTIALPN